MHTYLRELPAFPVSRGRHHAQNFVREVFMNRVVFTSMSNVFHTSIASIVYATARE